MFQLYIRPIFYHVNSSFLFPQRVGLPQFFFYNIIEKTLTLAVTMSKIFLTCTDHRAFSLRQLHDVLGYCCTGAVHRDVWYSGW